MSETIITALITGAVTLLGVIASNNKQQAVTDTKIEELTREVREHNGFAHRMPVLEEKVDAMQNDIRQLQSYHHHA